MTMHYNDSLHVPALDITLMFVSYLRHIFYKADKNGDEALDFKEIWKLMQHLNVPADVNQMKQLCEVRLFVLFYINFSLLSSSYFFIPWYCVP